MKILILFIILIIIIRPVYSQGNETIVPVSSEMEGIISRMQGPPGVPLTYNEGSINDRGSPPARGGTTNRGGSGDFSNHESQSSDSVIFFKNDIYINTLEYPKKSVSDSDDNLRKVFVEIISNSDKNTTLNIREFIDKNLSMLLPSLHGYVLSTPHDIALYKLGLLEELESNKSIKVDEQTNDIQFVSGGYRYNISKHKLYEINKLNDILAYSRNKNVIFIWSNKLNNSYLSNYTELYRFLESDLMISDIRNHAGLIKCSNDSIEIKINGRLIILFKSKNKIIDNNSIILEYNNITTHLMCKYAIINKNSSNDTSYITYVYNINDIIAFDNVEIPPGSMFVYWYYVFPKSFGTFRTETISFSIADGSRGFHQEKLDIENRPIFEVAPKALKSGMDINDILGLEFSVVHLGGGPQSSSGNIPVEFESNSDYSFVNENGYPVNPNCMKDFPKDVSVPINMFVKFKEKGIYSVPGIWINKRHYLSNKDITVDDRFERNKGLLGSLAIAFVALIVFVLGLIIRDLYLMEANYRKSWRMRLETYWKKTKDFLGTLKNWGIYDTE
jgi:hypothetical protein